MKKKNHPVCVHVFKAYYPDSSDIALFGTDVATDWVNGYNMIMEDHVIWGTVMCILPLAPAGLVGPTFAFQILKDKLRNKFCRILTILLLYIPAVLVATPCYIGFVLLTGVLKFWIPTMGNVHGKFLFENFGGDDFIFYAAWMKIAEIVTESCPQAMLGKFSHAHCVLTVSQSHLIIH